MPQSPNQILDIQSLLNNGPNNNNNNVFDRVVSPDNSINGNPVHSTANPFGPTPSTITPTPSVSKPILVSQKIFVAIIIVLAISIFLSMTVITGLSRPNSIDHEYNYIPTLQSGYHYHLLNTTTANIIDIKSTQAITTIPPFHSKYPTSRQGELFTMEITNIKKFNKLRTAMQNRLISVSLSNPDLFGFSGVVSNDGLPVFSFIGHGNILYLLHCENLMCSESSIAAIDLNVFYPLSTAQAIFQNGTNRPETGNVGEDGVVDYAPRYPFFFNAMSIPTPPPGVPLTWTKPTPDSESTTTTLNHQPLPDVISPDPGPFTLPLNATTKIILSPSAKPYIAVAIDSGELMLALCETITCQEGLSRLILLHTAVAANSIALNVNPDNIVIVFTLNYKPHPKLNARPVQLVICSNNNKNHDCSDFWYRTILGLYASLASMSLSWQVEAGLTLVFPGFWLPTPISGDILKPFFSTTSSSSSSSSATTALATINLLDYEVFTTVSMHPYIAVAFAKLAVNSHWLKAIENDQGYYVFSANPFTSTIQQQLRAMLLQFYTIDDTLGFNGDDLGFDFEQIKAGMDVMGGVDGDDDGDGRKIFATATTNDFDDEDSDFDLDNYPQYWQTQPVYGSRSNVIQKQEEGAGSDKLSSSSSHHQPQQQQHNNYRRDFERQLRQQTKMKIQNYQKVAELRKFRAHVDSNPSLYPSSISNIMFSHDNEGDGYIRNDDDIDLDNNINPSSSTPSQPSLSSTATIDPARTITYPNGDTFNLPARGSIILGSLTPSEFESLYTSIKGEIQLMISQYSGLPHAYYRTDASNPDVMEPKTLYLTCQHQCRPGSVTISLPLASHPTLDGLSSPPTSSTTPTTPTTPSTPSTSEVSPSTASITTSPSDNHTSTPALATSILSSTTPIRTYRPTEIEGKLRDVTTLDGVSKMTVLLLHNQEPYIGTDGQIVTHQSLSSFGCVTPTCQRTTEDVDKNFPPSIGTEPKISQSKYYYSLFGGSVGSLTTIISNMTDATHLSVDADPFFSSYQYLLFDFGQLPMYSRCFDSRCHTMHVQPLLSSPANNFHDLNKLNQADLNQIYDFSADTETKTPRDPADDLVEAIRKANADEKIRRSFGCTSTPCFTILISPIDSMVLILVGNTGTSIIHCSDMFCLPFSSP